MNIKRNFVFAVFLLLFASSNLFSQVIIDVDEIEGKSKPSLNRERGLKILRKVKSTLEDYYYDKTFKGIDLDAKFDAAADEIKKLDTNAEIFRLIAGLLLKFNDSHTLFYPPNRSNRVEYGFSIQMIGPKCLIIDVTKGSDAEKKGLKVGDQVTKIGQHQVTRDSLWALTYFIYQLEPMPRLPVTLVGPAGKERSVLVNAIFKSLEERQKEAYAKRKQRREDPYKCAKIGSDLTACKLKTFSVEKKYIEQMMKEVAGSSKMILDLRGNRGGYVKIGQYLTGHFFDREVKIADMIGRRKTETRVAKPVKDERRFTGELIVLIDSNSASASEVFARLVQIEKRGIVVGDISAGAVMTSYGVPMQIDRGAPGFQTITPFALSVTVADLVMSDGKRLESVGVVPDHPVGPTPFALIKRSDPVLSYAVKQLGGAITGEDAGKLEFLFNRTEDELEDGADSEDEEPEK